MERNLDEHGSIVIKTPDVWGESRLMRHRADVETQLKARLNGFNFRINAVQSTRDAAFLATAIALQEQIGSNDVGALTGSAPTTPAPNNVNSATAGMIANPMSASSAPAFVPRNPFNTATNVFSGTVDNKINVQIEPVIELDQLNRYLQHLNELRRLNEGDDNTDTPGYALNLIRIPVSVLPGRKTQEGFGAEVQMTIDPYISDEILPLAFKDFVINGVVDRIGFDVFQIALRTDLALLSNAVERDQPAVPADEAQTGITPLPVITSPARIPAAEPGGEVAEGFAETDNKSKRAASYHSLSGQSPAVIQMFIQNLAKPGTTVKVAAMDAGVDSKDLLDDPVAMTKQAKAVLVLEYHLLADVNHRDLAAPSSHRDSINGDTLHRLALHTYRVLVNTGVSSTEAEVQQTHRVEHGLAMPEVETLLREESVAAYRFLSQPRLSYLWTEFCTSELARKVREHRRIPIRANQNATEPTADSVEVYRRKFFKQISDRDPEARNSVTDALAWQIIVESALLNEQMIQDMRETASLKNCPCITQTWADFFGPNPSVEARYAFKEYVRCKWPIHVFALDPVTQDQNIADTFSQRREMQMAIAIAAANQGLGGQALSRFVRRLEYDLETIELNRTAVGFSHGDNTFGWQFLPRVQAPPAPSNLRATFGDLLIGGQDRNDLLRTRRLEPGIRECTALVVMPSFVPQVTVDVRTTWFRLAKHTPLLKFMARRPGYENSMELSRELVNLKRLQQRCVQDAHLYRNGEVFRLCKAVERLDRRLPLQTHHVSVPWENDLGGFELFQSGTRVLGPELHGWYGAPGVIVADEGRRRNSLVSLMSAEKRLSDAKLDLSLVPSGDEYNSVRANREKEVTGATGALGKAREIHAAVLASQTDTAVFLVGKNFSVLNCRVISGGVDVTGTIQVINRNLMQVRIPSTVSTVATDHGTDEQRHVVVHVASPCGATSRLLIPVAGQTELSTAAAALEAVTKAKDAAVAAAGTASGAQAAAESANTKVRAVSSQLPVSLVWNSDAKDLKFCVKITKVRGLPKSLHFCPVADGFTELPVTELKASSPWTPDKKTRNVTGEFALYVKIPDVGKKAVGPWKINDGKVQVNNKWKPLTANLVVNEVLSKVFGHIDCTSKDPVEIEVTGFVRFDNGQPVMRVTHALTFELKIEDEE
ncbi:MAG: hypothetical protein GY903_02320 [Fuerstiella sp.]|nr:hypothetical protein [Fuerstiella sp.]MCP4853314.1 hypothetical protein [Fuerstiella sp.]